MSEINELLTEITKRLYKDLEILDHLKGQINNPMPDYMRVRLENKIASLEDRIITNQTLRDEISNKERNKKC